MNKDNLLKNKCEPCSGNTPKLNLEQISKYLSDLKDWSVNDKQEMIFKKYKFNNFNKALEFVNKVGILSDQEGHHPDISLGWGYCIIMLHTHAIKGLSINDFILASKIDKIN